MRTNFDLAIYNRLKNGGHIAAELTSNHAQCRRWVAIYKSPAKPIQSNIPKHLYSILDFELEKEKIDTYFADEDMLNQKRYYVKSEEELITKLWALDIDLKIFTYPWKCDYPL